MERLLTILFILCASLAFAQVPVAPSLYYQFELAAPLASTTGGPLTGGGTYTIEPGQVGTCFNWANNLGTFLQAPTLTGSNSTVQFLWKSNFETSRGKSSKILEWGNLSIIFEYPYILYITPSGTSQAATWLELSGINNMSWQTTMSKDWVHFAFVYSGTGQQIWINGQLVLTSAAVAGSVSGTPRISSGVNYVKVKGSIDELAFYTSAIPDRQIYQNYLDFLGGNHYTTALAPAVIPGPPVTGAIDTLEFTKDIPRETQLSVYPAPRYKPGNGLMKNFNWMDPKFMGGVLQPGISNAQAAVNAVTIQTEMAKNWNYYYLVGTGAGTFQDAYVAGANANPSFKLSTILFRAQLNGNNPEITSQTKTAAHYLQNSFGQFLDAQGNITAGTKTWRPTAPTASYVGDGNSTLSLFNSLFTTLINPIDIVNENGELFPLITDSALAKDPQVVTAKNASGLSYSAFLGRKFAENETQSYRDIFMTHPKLSAGKFTEYAIDGYSQNNFRLNYSEARKVNYQINGQYYSTPDFYPRWPNNWRYWVSAWHGWQWIVECRNTEIPLGDKLFSPFVSAGWSATEPENVRPAQFLGLLKCLSGVGAEFYYSGFFSLSAPWPDSKNWIWQVSTSSYAQAITSRIESTYLRGGVVMDGDIPDSYIALDAGTAKPGYNFYTGKDNTIVTVRKSTGVEKYFITATFQNISNYGGTPLSDTVTISLAGQQLRFNVRRHGSCYVYDKTVSPPTFVQLDTWHQYEHPSRWTDDFNFESEVTDGGTGTVKTDVAGPNYTTFTSYYYGTGQYNFLSRATAMHWLYIRARSSTAAEITATIGAASQTVCIDSAAWKWVRFESDGTTKAKFSLTTATNYVINISSGSVEVDQFVLSQDSALFSPTPSSCGGTPPPPVCTWVTGSWSSWSAVCSTGYQYRTRTVTSSLAGCTPPEAQPAVLDSTVCVCGWVTSNWSVFGNCITGYQYRTRTSVTSLPGCTPAIAQPALVDSLVCVCSWVTGPWGAYSPCNGVYQVRSRTVVSSLSGCVPPGLQPAATDTLSCTVPPPTCYWSTGVWSAWSVCISNIQTRSRTVTSTIQGCTPGTPMPAVSDTQACSTPGVIPAPSSLIVVSPRWYNVNLQWAYTNPVEFFQVELIRSGSVVLDNYPGTARNKRLILRINTQYTFRIRAYNNGIYSAWTSVTFRTIW